MELLLSRHDDGMVLVRWKRFALLTLLVTVGGIAANFALAKLLGGPFRPLSSLAISVVIVLTWLSMLYFAKRKAENKPLQQVSVRALLVGLTGLAIFFAITTHDQELRRQGYEALAQLQTQLKPLVGTDGHVSVSGNPASTMISSIGPDFNDDDLARLINKLAETSVNAPVTLLDLSGTKVTDSGVVRLAKLDSLEYLFLGSTLVTDLSIDVVQQLDKLKVIGVMNTAVTDQRLLELNRLRKQLDISPKSYQKLANAKKKN